jgi:hypothetical protein
MALRDHASYYYRALKDNAEEVKRAFAIIEAEYSKNIKEKDRLAALLQNTTSFDEDVFNNLSLVYSKKEYKFVKPYEYYLSMRSKELGLIEPEVEEEATAGDDNKKESNLVGADGISLGMTGNENNVGRIDVSQPL